MPYLLRQWPGVYPDEIDQGFPEAREAIDVVLQQLRDQGPSPLGYMVKNLGKQKNYIWQLNLKVEKRQVRILYWPDKKTIVVLHIHKKSSPQEQQAAYAVAMNRKKQAEKVIQGSANVHGSLPAIH